MRLKNKGIAITEVLVATAILSFISMAILKTVDISLLSSNVANSLLADADLKIALYNTLDHTNGQCKTNLHPDKFSPSGSNTLNSLTRYEIPIPPTSPAGVELIKKDELFREYLKIVKLELSGAAPDIHREFKVYYTRERAKNLKTKDGKPCTETDTSGCYVNICQMEYKLNSAGTDVDTCTLLNCSGLRNSGGGQAAGVNAECYKVTDTGGSPEKVTLVGCGTTEDITKKTTVAFGFNAGGSGVSGGGNTFVGYESGKKNTSGNLNTFVGYEAGKKTTSGQNNTFIGNVAGNANQNGHQNTFVGSAAGNSNSTGRFNNFFGFEVGFGNTIGENNSYFGHHAGKNGSSGNSNNFFGNNAGEKSTGSNNNFFGYQAGQNTTSGTENIFIGNQAGHQNTTGKGNIFIGDNAGNLSAYQTENNKFIIGNNADPTDPDATRDWIVGEIGTDRFEINGKQVFLSVQNEDNTFYGFEAGKENTTGSGNSFFGSKAGHNNTTGSQNTYIGHGAGKANNSRGGNTFIGYGAGEQNTGYGIFIGHSAGKQNTGYNNIFIGNSAGLKNGDGWMGTGEDNTFIGHRAGVSNTRGNHNIFIGNETGQSNLQGQYNNFFGNGAGSSNTRGSRNTFIGYGAGSSNTTGQNNTFIGFKAGEDTTGSWNTFIGYGAGKRLTAGSNNIIIGHGAGDYATEINSQFIVGNSSDRIWIIGEIGGNELKVNNQQVDFISSSRTLKKNIKRFKNYDKALKDILNTPLFSFQFKDNHPNKKRVGIISEELPKNLQIKENPILPDMPSIRGTLWAGIKALHKMLMDFKNEISSQINNLTETLNSQLKQLKNLSLKYENVSVEQKEIKALIIKNTKELEALKKENKALKEKIIQITNKSD